MCEEDETESHIVHVSLLAEVVVEEWLCTPSNGNSATRGTSLRVIRIETDGVEVRGVATDDDKDADAQ